MSEDIYFSKKIQAMGFDVWVDPEIKCHHRNSIDLLEMMERGEGANNLIEKLEQQVEQFKADKIK